MSHRFMYQNRLSSSVTISPLSMARGVVGGAVPRVANGSGGVILTGPYTGDGQRIYTVEIDLAGDVGVATFKWRTTDTAAGAWEASGVLTSLADVTLSAGVKVRFTAGAGTDFSLGDRWEATASNRFGKRFLYDLDPNQRFRTGTPSDPETVAFGLLTAQEVKAAVLHLHNISSGATVKIQAGPDPQLYALLLDGANSRAVTTDAAAIQNIWDGGGSVFFRTKLNSPGEANLGTFFDKNLFGIGTKGWYFNQGTQFGTFRPGFSCLFTSGEARHLGPDAMFTAGVVASVGLSYNSDAPGNVPAIYKDGVAQAITSFAAPTGTRVSDAGANLYIGDRTDGATSLDGWMDEVKFFNRTLTAQEFLDLHNGVLPSDQATSLVLHLKFDEGTGTSAADSSASGLTTALQGAAAWTSGIYSPLDETLAWRAGTMFRYLTTALKTYRHWRLRIGGDAGNPDGRIEIGELYLGDYFEPAEDFGWNSVPGGEEAVERRQETESGTPRDVLLNRLRSARLGYGHLADAQVASFRAMFQAVKDAANGRNLPLLAHLDVDDGGESLKLYRLGASFAPAVEGPDDNTLEIELLERGT